jgi:uncharacterized protein (DUF433 family)
VRIRPDVRFGRPNVAGISTEVLWEHVDSGEAIERVAEDYGLEIGDVQWALAYELGMRAKRTA